MISPGRIVSRSGSDTSRPTAAPTDPGSESASSCSGWPTSRRCHAASSHAADGSGGNSVHAATSEFVRRRGGCVGMSVGGNRGRQRRTGARRNRPPGPERVCDATVNDESGKICLVRQHIGGPDCGPSRRSAGASRARRLRAWERTRRNRAAWAASAKTSRVIRRSNSTTCPGAPIMSANTGRCRTRPAGTVAVPVAVLEHRKPDRNRVPQRRAHRSLSAVSQDAADRTLQGQPRTPYESGVLEPQIGDHHDERGARLGRSNPGQYIIEA